MNYSIEDIAAVTGAQWLNSTVFPSAVDEILFDTRKGSLSDHALFLAISGANTDGHKHIRYAYDVLDVRNFMVSKRIDIRPFPKANFLLVPDVIPAIHQWAIFHRKKFYPTVIGITGSNGKTIIKEWIYQLAESERRIVRSPGSYNSQMGVPLSVLQMGPEHELAVFEAGISLRGEMKRLREIIRPDIGIISNIGEAHAAGFRDKTEKLKEKLTLFEECPCLIYRSDQFLVKETVRDLFPSERLVSWSTHDNEADYFVSVQSREGEMDITIRSDQAFQFRIPFSDEVSLENAVFAMVACMESGISPEKLRNNAPKLRNLKMRLEIKEGINQCVLINDTYISDLGSLSSALSILNQQDQSRKNTLIISQIEESGLAESELLHRISQLVTLHKIKKVIALGEQLKELQSILGREIEFLYYQDTEELLKAADALLFERENILIKGARKFNMERIFEALSTKVHQTILEINMEALRHNLSIYRSMLPRETRLMVILKASGYGSGARELARFLEYQHVDYIAVAYVDEGVELRKAGISLPIMVMNPEEAGFNAMIDYQLEPEIYSISQLKSLVNHLKGRVLPIHLKIETGMHRLGFSFNMLAELCAFLKQQPGFRVKSVFSHLVGSEDPAMDEFSHKQKEQFDKAYGFVSEELGCKPIRHLLNSNGISRFPEYQMEMVRLGIGLHGISEDEPMRQLLQKVHTLKTRVSQVKAIKPGSSVGYNRKFIAEKLMEIATINIGYADGLPRNAGNGNYSVLALGQPAPIVGNVCMDMCMIDVTGLGIKSGDQIIVFGQEWPVEVLAKSCGTIPYEILTRLSSRIHRIFSRM